MTATDIVTGSTEAHLLDLNEGLLCSNALLVHKQVVAPLLDLQNAAQEAGFELRVCSSFRSFERQLQIWNGKVSGMRPIMDPFGSPIDAKGLSPWRKVQAILRWSALPGASRHHWGTDFDIYDAKAMPEGYQIQLIPEEVQGAGLFAPMHDWLDGYLSSEQPQFYRPYKIDTGGIAPERWHISYRPLADQYYSLLDAELITKRLRDSDLLLLDVVLEHLDEIMHRYILVDY
jgi:LAS superfamily LD-carboxypeptidase LdcB